MNHIRSSNRRYARRSIMSVGAGNLASRASKFDLGSIFFAISHSASMQTRSLNLGPIRGLPAAIRNQLHSPGGFLGCI